MIPVRLKPWLKYVLGSGDDDPRCPAIVDGDVCRYHRMTRLSRSRCPSVHFALSYSSEDHPSATDLIEDVHSFLALLSPGLPRERLAYVAIRHFEAHGDQIGDPVEARKRSHRVAVHILISTTDLATGRRLQLYYPRRDHQRLRAWCQKVNQQKGYSCPSETHRWKRNRPKLAESERLRLTKLLARTTGQLFRTKPSPGAEDWYRAMKATVPTARYVIPSPNVPVWSAYVYLPGDRSPTVLDHAIGAMQVQIRPTRKIVKGRRTHPANKVLSFGTKPTASHERRRTLPTVPRHAGRGPARAHATPGPNRGTRNQTRATGSSPVAPAGNRGRDADPRRASQGAPLQELARTLKAVLKQITPPDNAPEPEGPLP